MYNNTQAFEGAVELRYSVLVAFYRSTETKAVKATEAICAIVLYSEIFRYTTSL